MVAQSPYPNKSNLPITKDVRVVLPSDVFIPGSSVLEIGATLQGKIDTQTTTVVEWEKLPESSVRLATCIVETKSDTENPVVSVTLMNLSSEGVTIYKGTRVGLANALEGSESFVVISVKVNLWPKEIYLSPATAVVASY